MLTNPSLPKLIANLSKNAYVDIYKEFDVYNGYREYSIRCQDLCERYTDIETFNGQGVFPILNSEQCRFLRELIDTKDERLYEHKFKVEILDSVIAPKIDEIILSYFESEYIPCWMKYYKNNPEDLDDSQVSFKWHCDGGPEKHLKILFYLNSAEESGGDTVLMNRRTTFLLKELGYLYCNINNRTSDLSELCKLYNIPHNPIAASCKEGEALIFAPMSYIHKGFWPTKGPRYLLQICLIPSTLPWRDACIKHKAPLDQTSWPNVTVT